MQTLKKVVKKIGAISTGLAFMGTTLTGALAQGDLADYPAPFVVGGKYVDTAIISSDSQADSASATAILNAFAGLITTSGSTSSTTTVTVAGAYKIEKSGNELNFDDDAYDVDSKLDDNDLPVILVDGTFEDNEGTNTGETDYEQFLLFSDNKSSTDKSVGLIYDRNLENRADGKPVTDYLFLSKTSSFSAYTYEWKLNTKVDLADAADLENNVIEILGKRYTIVDATVTSGNVTKMTLLAGETTDTIATGETVSGATLISVDSNGNKCTIEFGGSQKVIDQGQTVTFSDGTIIGVSDVIPSNKQADPDHCEVNIGADKVELKNANKVKVNGVEIDGTKTTFQTGGLKKFNVTYSPKDRIYMAKGDSYTDPIFSAFKFLYEGVTEDTEDIVIDSIGDEVTLSTTNKDGDVIDITYCYTNSSKGDLRLGSDVDEQLIVKEGQGLLSAQSTTGSATSIEDLEGTKFLYSFNEIAHIIEISNIESGTNNRTDFVVLDTGTTYSDKDWTADTNQEFTFLANTFKLNFSIARQSIVFNDINDKGATIFTEYGANITFESLNDTVIANTGLPYIDQTNECGLTIQEIDTGKETDIPLSTVYVNFTYDTTDSEIEIDTITATKDGRQAWKYAHGLATMLTRDDDSNNNKVARTPYGTLIHHYNKNDGDVTISYPDEASYGNIFVAPLTSTAVVTGGGTASSALVALASEVSDVTAYNAIVVGGPCANSAAADVLGVTYAGDTCAEGFTEGEAVIELKTNGNNVAMVVAGYTQDDTLKAGRVLESFGAYDLSGASATVSGTTTNPTVVTGSA